MHGLAGRSNRRLRERFTSIHIYARSRDLETDYRAWGVWRIPGCLYLYMFSVAIFSCYILQFDYSTCFQLVYLIPTGRIPGNTMLNTYSAAFSTCYTLLPRQLSTNYSPTKQKTLLKHCPVTNKPSTQPPSPNHQQSHVHNAGYLSNQSEVGFPVMPAHFFLTLYPLSIDCARA